MSEDDTQDYAEFDPLRLDRTFNPNQHTMPLNGKAYLPVQARIAWFRSLEPDGELTTELVEHDLQAGFAAFKATVRRPSGSVSTAYGSELRSEFQAYFEKAETVAVGRALAHAGYGTMAAGELSRGDDGATKLADAPVGGGGYSQYGGGGGYQKQGGGGGGRPATQKQIDYALNLAKGAGFDPDEYAMTNFGRSFPDLDGRDVSQMIERLREAPRGGQQQAPAYEQQYGEYTNTPQKVAADFNQAPVRAATFHSKLATKEEVRTALNLSLPDDDQKGMWEQDVVAVYAGDPNSEKTKDDLRFMVNLAWDACDIDKQQSWRFIDLIKHAKTGTQITGVEKFINAAGVNNQQFAKLIADRRA